MKKLLTVVAMVYASTSFAQTTTTTDSLSTPVVTTTDTTNQVQVIDYNQYTKLQLTDIYLKEVVRVTSGLSTCAFDTISNSVPNTKYTQSKFNRTREKSDKYNEILLQEFKEIIPYSDKQDLIKAILYLKSLN